MLPFVDNVLEWQVAITIGMTLTSIGGAPRKGLKSWIEAVQVSDLEVRSPSSPISHRLQISRLNENSESCICTIQDSLKYFSTTGVRTKSTQIQVLFSPLGSGETVIGRWTNLEVAVQGKDRPLTLGFDEV